MRLKNLYDDRVIGLWRDSTGNDNIMDLIKKCYEEKRPLGQAMHRKVMDYFRQYMIVGRYATSSKRIYKYKRF